MTGFDDLPLVQFRPGETDAELAAERNTKHERAVAEWFGMDWILAGLTAGAVALSLGIAPAAASPAIVGGQGLCPNARNLAHHIQSTYPGVLSIGGVRADALPDHPSGHAIDIMVGTNVTLGNTIAADVRSQSARFGVKYVLWQSDPAHWDHVHVTVE